MPNTGLALRLARALQVRVEDLFELDAHAAMPYQAVDVELIISDPTVKPGQPVQLCQVGDRMIAVPSPPVPVYLPTADGVIVGGARRGQTGATAVQFSPDPLPIRLLIAGCDPAMSVLAAHASRVGVDVALASCNSSQALEFLLKKRIHIAGTHLRDVASGESKVSAITKMFPRESVRVVTFASWQEGFVVAPRNPKNIRSAGDLAGGDVRIANREPGSGSRILLDLELKKAGVKLRSVPGYDRVARGHLPAAWHVLSGLADCCIATEAAARAFGLDFVPISSERFDFVIPMELASSSPVQRVLDAMQRSAFRRELDVLGGYDTSHTGQVVT
jgi:molybdate-binding protein